jgi:hypothetical protein
MPAQFARPAICFDQPCDRAHYFVIERFEDLFDVLKKTDFSGLYDRLRAEETFTPFEILERDGVIRRGTGEHPKGSAGEKKLK